MECNTRASCPPCCLPHVFPTLFGPGWVSPPHIGLSPLHPAHITMSPALHILLTCAHTSHFPAHMPLTCASCPPPNVSSPTHPAHLVRSQWISPHAYASHLCILPTSLCLFPHASCPPH